MKKPIPELCPEQLEDLKNWSPSHDSKEHKELVEVLKKDLANTHLRHAMLSALHSHLKNYMQCMNRNYFGYRSDKEIELTKKLHEVMEYTDSVLSTYYVTEAEIMGN